MDTKQLTFTELRPGARKERVNTIRVWKGRITLGALAYEELGEPSSVKLEVDPKNNVIKITPQGPFNVGKSHAISSVGLSAVEEGLYTPVGNGLYKWAVDEG